MEKNSPNDLWDEFKKLKFSKKKANEWCAKRYSIEEFEGNKEALTKLDIIIHGEGFDLISIQNDLNDRGVIILTPVKESNLFYNYMTIDHFERHKVEDVFQKTSTEETLDRSPDDLPQL